MDKHIFLIGMMGCGKSTLGRMLAAQLSCGFTDLDDAIEAYEGRTIPEIFAAAGDAGFRLCESAALDCVIDESPRVVATGGGIITREYNIDRMRKHGVVVWLNRPLEDMIATVRQDTRPNLAGDKEERMRTLFAAREALYRRAAHVVFDNRMPPHSCVPQLCALLKAQNLI